MLFNDIWTRCIESTHNISYLGAKLHAFSRIFDNLLGKILIVPLSILHSNIPLFHTLNNAKNASHRKGADYDIAHYLVNTYGKEKGNIYLKQYEGFMAGTGQVLVFKRP